MAMLSYLRWILDNRFYLGDTRDVIDFPKPLKVSYNGKDYIEYLNITKRQGSRVIKINSIYNSTTLSTLPRFLQGIVYNALNSMDDSRYSFDWNRIYKIEKDEQDSKKK